MSTPYEHTSPGEIPVRGFLHLPERLSLGGLVLTHGAGANCQSPLLLALATAFSDSGLAVLRCDLPFRQLQPYGPPPRASADRDQEGLRRAVEVMQRQVSGRIFLGGHLYGGRQASMLAASQPGLVDGLLLLSYPLHPPKRADQLRTAHFPSLRTPALFVHGNRDGFGSILEMTAALKLIPAATELLPVTSAGHELLTSRNRSELPNNVVGRFSSFAVGENAI
jgi:predicted alpha/beta-hydrolase family hydrolase